MGNVRLTHMGKPLPFETPKNIESMVTTIIETKIPELMGVDYTININYPKPSNNNNNLEYDIMVDRNLSPELEKVISDKMDTENVMNEIGNSCSALLTVLLP